MTALEIAKEYLNGNLTHVECSIGHEKTAILAEAVIDLNQLLDEQAVAMKEAIDLTKSFERDLRHRQRDETEYGKCSRLSMHKRCYVWLSKCGEKK